MNSGSFLKVPVYTSGQERFGSIDDWAVYFVEDRSNLWFDRRWGRKVEGVLPCDGLLSAASGEFEVLLAQLRLGGLVPGFPNSFFRIPSPARLVFQNLGAFDLPEFLEFREAAPYGVAFQADNLKNLELFGDVIDGRPDAEFDDLLSWNNQSQFASEVLVPLGDGGVGFVSVMPFLLDDLVERMTVFVGERSEAELIREVITARRMLLIGRESEPRWQGAAQFLDDTIIVWPGDPSYEENDEAYCWIEGLYDYAQIAGVSPVPEQQFSAQAELLASEIGPFTSVSQKAANADGTFTFQTFVASDPGVASFLRAVGLAVPNPTSADGSVSLLMSDELQPLLSEKFDCVFTEQLFVLRN
ncbi:hypothetical protein ACC693_22655 [Rhizobium ruizarguesonis]